MINSRSWPCATHNSLCSPFVRTIGMVVVASAIALKCEGDPPAEGVPDGHPFNMILAAATTSTTSAQTATLF
jgi:hypothetical protein